MLNDTKNVQFFSLGYFFLFSHFFLSLIHLTFKTYALAKKVLFVEGRLSFTQLSQIVLNLIFKP
jgi:hypothetical protein